MKKTKRKMKGLKQDVEDFLNSDKASATAAKFILAVLATGGIFFVGAVAPNIFQAFGKFQRRKKYSKEQMRNSFYNLKRGGFIEIIQERNDKMKVRLTNKGKERVKIFSLDSLVIRKPKWWDGKWRIVIFDIPVKFNKAREVLRTKLKELGFYQLQKSVWVYPYDCEDEILFIANVFQVEPFVEIITANKLLHEYKLRKSFKLPAR